MPAQMDYAQATKASGNGGFEMIVLSPGTVQEAVDLTYKAFELADRDRNPVLILSDGVIGAMMEPVDLPEMMPDEKVSAIKNEKRSWAIVGHSLEEKRSWIQPGQWQTDEMEKANMDAYELYKSWEKDAAAERYMVEDAEIILTGHGISGRVAKSAVEQLREDGIKAGLIRPITVHPFPVKAFNDLDYKQVKYVLDVEMSIPAQMVHDVESAVKERCPVRTCLRSGGNIMTRDLIVQTVKSYTEV